MTRRIALTIVMALALALAATPALAGKPVGGGGKPKPVGTGGGGTITLVLLNSTDGVPHFAQRVTFAVSTTATNQPWVVVKCSKGGTVVYEQANGIFPTSLGQTFNLGPTPAWSSGDADCTATLQIWGGSTLATMSFHVFA